jgi:hypothetical protein
MTQPALEKLIEASRALPGHKMRVDLDGAPLPPRTTEPSPTAGRGEDGAGRVAASPAVDGLHPQALRKRVGAVLAALAARVDEALPRALALAGSAWDQVDSLTLLDPELRAELGLVRRAASALAVDPDPGRRAGGVEAALTLDGAVGLVHLLERRLATLVRLRLRSDDPALLDGRGRPFLDVAAALKEAASAWV